jgi:ATP-binding cassette subfamily F protein uup
MSLLNIQSLSKSFGLQPLFKQISFTIAEHDQIGLIGPNGAGKSTLLKILMNLETADEGLISKRQGLRIGYSSQSPQFESKSVEQILVEACTQGDEFEKETRARTLLSKALFDDFEQKANALSGGWKKRLDIIKALMNEPDLLLLDEPTNHLDLDGILWLEKFLMREKPTFMVISHDRYFLEMICNRVIELNRCYPQGLFSSQGDMQEFYTHKELFLLGQAEKERSLASLAKSELEWLKRSPKARTTKSRARIQRTHELLEDLGDLKSRNKQHKVELEFTASQRETRNLLVATSLCKAIHHKPLFSNLHLKLTPGTRLGVVGANGTGKTTLLKILAGQLPFDSGTIKCADELKLVYFDQHREEIDSEDSLRTALSPNSDTVVFRGQSIHVNGWAKKFLFPVEKLDMAVKYLSGGERARILIARLMLKPADILFLDEPTNDLDIPTLQVIEENLVDFPGAVVLISHDRCLMDRVCTQILGLGTNLEHPYFADYTQWEKAFGAQKNKKAGSSSSTESPPKVEIKSVSNKLNFKEQKELASIEKKILEAELELQKIQGNLSSNASHEIYQELAAKQLSLENLFSRWQHLLERA